MRLLPFADPAPPCVRSLVADCESRAGDTLGLSYRLEGDLSRLRLPAPATPRRADGLWHHTCFEAFFGVAGSRPYCELNFSPSGAWAAYAFEDYRAGMQPLRLSSPPRARWKRSAQVLELTVEIDAAELVGAHRACALRLGLAAVIEERSGTISHWALHHPTGEPDFHRHEGFVLDLSGPMVGARGETTGT
jgi:hypothetical protein